DTAPDAATIVGDAGDNEMVGNAGTNYLAGLGGSNTYRAGDGTDYLLLGVFVDDTGTNGPNTVFVEERATGDFSYDIVFDFESGKDKFNVESFDFASAAAAFATGEDDGLGNSYFVLGDGLDYLYVM